MRYHRDIGFPTTIILPSSIRKLIFTDHAWEKGEDIPFYKWIHGTRKIKPETIVELFTDDDVLVKQFVLRLDYDKSLDISIAVDMKGFTGIIKTMWLNRKKDTHRTLDKSIYDIPKINQHA
jgi:hypothetical protein